MTTISDLTKIDSLNGEEKLEVERNDLPESKHFTIDMLQEFIKKSPSSAIFRVGSGPSYSYRIGGEYAELDELVRGAILFDGTSGFKNILGSPTAVPVTNDSNYSPSADSGYTNGDADVSAILAGYDNVNNSLAGIMASQHSMLYAGAAHGTILGGSQHYIAGQSNYSTILGGTKCYIDASSKAMVASSSLSQIKSGSTSSVMLGGDYSTNDGARSVSISTLNCENLSQYSSIIAAKDSKIFSASDYSVISGSGCKIGESASSQGGEARGLNCEVNGLYGIAKGSGSKASAAYTIATGAGAVASVVGMRVHTSRNRGNVAGNNLQVDLNCSQETTDDSIKRLSVYGASGYPTLPEDSSITATAHITACQPTGETSAYQITFSATRIGSNDPVINAQTVTEIHNGIGLTVEPSIVSTAGGIYRVQVQGLAATDIYWNCDIRGNQMVFT